MFEALNEIYGLAVSSEECSAPAGLPLYMTAGRNFHHVKICGAEFLAVTIEDEQYPDVRTLKKQLERYEAAVGFPAAFYMNKSESRKLQALIQKGIPFISTDGQVFLPFLGIWLKNHFSKEVSVNGEFMSPATQMLFLLLLYSEQNQISKSEAAQKLGISRMSLTRASRQLQEMGLLEERKVGRESRISPTEYGISYFEKAKPYLINPVQKTMFVKKPKENLISAGESALSTKSMLNPPRISVFAIFKDDSTYKNYEEVDPKWSDEDNVIQLQLWKYPPEVFASDGAVDVVSLACSLRNAFDERVESEMETALEVSFGKGN